MKFPVCGAGHVMTESVTIGLVSGMRIGNETSSFNATSVSILLNSIPNIESWNLHVASCSSRLAARPAPTNVMSGLTPRQ